MHCCPRYLIFFQYIGSRYSGAAKVPPHQLWKKGIQDHLEDAIGKLRPINPVSLSISSRTDTGVHALCNSAHFDLQRRDNKAPFTEDVLVEALNFHLGTEQISGCGPGCICVHTAKKIVATCRPPTVVRGIGSHKAFRITHAHRVSDNFHARFRADSRTYVYRIALGVSHRSLLPLTDHDLCWTLRDTELDVGAMRTAAALLVGTHNFNSFRAVSSDMPFKSPVKTLDVADVQPGSSFSHTHFHRNIPLWELTFTSRSFLYRQVRRMTGALVAVGQGTLSVPQLKDILEAQDSLAFPQGVTAPAHGLFLTKVNYRDADLQFSQQTSEEHLPST